MTKILKVKFPDQCNGCELCVMEVQRQLKRVGLEGSLIRVFRDHSKTGDIEFAIELDPRLNTLDIESIKNICPKNVFAITEEENAGLIQ